MKSCTLALILTLTIGAVCTAQTTSINVAPRSVSQLQAAIKRQPNNADLYVSLGLAYWDKNDYPRALKAFEQAVKVGPRSAEAHNWLGVARSEKADLPGAIAEFRKAVALNPAYGRAFTNLGSALMKSGEVTEAVQVFQQALSLEPNSLAAHLNLGMALREKGDLDAALTHLRPVAAADPQNAGIQYELGQTLRQSGDLAGAVASFERALEIDPELREGYYGLGLVLKQQSASKRAAPAATDDSDAAAAAAGAAIAKGDLQGARAQLTAAVQRDDANAQAHNLLGYVLGQQGDPKAALLHLERAVALQPTLADAHYNLGAALWFSGSRERAVPALRESVRLDPAAGPAYAFLGMALRETGDLAGSRATLQRAIALLPPTPSVYVDLGITFLRLGQPALALGQFEAGLNLPTSPAGSAADWKSAIAALRDHAKSAEAHDVLGRLLGRQGASSNEVAAEFREAIRLKPDFAAAHNHLGLVLIQADDDDGGIAALREAVRLQPEYAEAHANLGAALTPIDVDAAIRELERAVALAPTSVNAQFNLAVAYGTSPAHGPAKEIEHLRQVIAMAPTFGRAHLALGKALLQEGKVDEATTALQEATRLEPSSGEAQYQLGLALARAGRKDDAAVALQKGRDLVAAADKAQLAALDATERRAATDANSAEPKAAEPKPAATEPPKPRPAEPTSAERTSTEPMLAGSLSINDDAARIAELEGYVHDKRFKEVEPLLADYVAKHPKSSWGWYALGYSQFAQQKIGDSIKSLSMSLSLDLHNAEAHKILGRNLMIIGRFDAAQTEFEEGLRSKPDSAELHYNLGKLFSMQDNWDAARKSFETALRLDPQYVEAIDGLGFALEALGDDEGAVAHYTKAIAINDERHGSFAASHVNLSAYYNRIGEADKALTYAQQAIALDPKSDRAWFQQARAEERQEHLAEAVNSLNTAISYNGRASSYYYVLAGLYRRLGRTDDSRLALDMFQRLDRESAELDKKRRGTAKTDAVPPGHDRD